MVLLLAGAVIPARAGTVAHYKFERTAPNSPLYEMTDSSGNGHHGAVVGQELFELGRDITHVDMQALNVRRRRKRTQK